MSDDIATNPDAGVAADAPVADVPQPDTEAPELADGEQAEAPVDDNEDIEFEGKQFRGPKAIKEALLRQADYTRKTQEVADQRRALEAQQAQFQQSEKLTQEHFAAIADLRNVDAQLHQYSQVNWQQLWDQDPQQAGKLNSQFQALQFSRQQMAGQLAQKQEQRNSEVQRQAATHLEQAEATLKRDIPNWSLDLQGKLRDFAIGKGIAPHDIAQINNPVVVKLLHLAYLGEQSISKARTAAKPAAPVAQPVPTVSARAAPAAVSPLSDKASTADWLKARNEQVRKQGRR